MGPVLYTVHDGYVMGSKLEVPMVWTVDQPLLQGSQNLGVIREPLRDYIRAFGK